MTTDNTQEHMHNSSEATSCAQWSAQAELDDILAKHNGELGITWEDPDVVTPDTKQALLDWHNKQVEEVLDRLEGENTIFKDYKYKDGVLVGTEIVCEGIPLSAIEAERNKLNNSDGDAK